MGTKQLPPFDIQGTRDARAILATDVAGYAVESSGSRANGVWFCSRDGQVIWMGVDGRDALPMFEVFTLAIATLKELQDRWKDWKAPPLPDDVPDPLRALMTTKPPMPVSPTAFEDWPFPSWWTQVLRRAEFIIDDVPVACTVGEHPNMQSAARPMAVPVEASASCEVTVGLLFTGPDGGRLLMGVDWTPFGMVVTDQSKAIEEFLAPCETIDLDAYLDDLE